MKMLICVDLQNDFVTGPLGSKEAESIIPNVVKKIKEYQDENNENVIFYTKDSHFEDYEDSLEGKKLPIEHCKFNSSGWNLLTEIEKVKKNHSNNCIIHKVTFGFSDWEDALDKYPEADTIELCGLCTDVCVVSNALIVRAIKPDTEIIVDAKCCAGTTPEKHKAALEVMKSCQIDIINE